MNKELEDKLFKNYPDLFPNGRKRPPTESLMCFGFECGDGWYDLINQLCKDLTKLGEKMEVHQVKEKFGGLRFYKQGGGDEAHKIIFNAEKESYKTCEVCGKKGNTTETGWIMVRCEEHKRKMPCDLE